MSEHTKNELLIVAIITATTAHRYQVRKGSGYPYIIHPLAVMNRVVDIDSKIVAVLHDTIEDTELELEHLLVFEFPQYIVDAVDAISKRTGESQHDYLDRVKVNELALTVKFADILHNMSDMSGISEKQKMKWMTKYRSALEYLGKCN